MAEKAEMQLATTAIAAGTIDFYRFRQSIEIPLTRGILNALPAGQLDYKPHPASQDASTICSTLLRCMRVCVDLTEANSSEMHFEAPPEKQELLNKFDQLAAGVGAGVEKKGQEFWEEEVTVYAQGTPVLKHSRGEIFWLFLFDQIHHRGQLSTYLRPMGSKVPSIYGKSADGNV